MHNNAANFHTSKKFHAETKELAKPAALIHFQQLQPTYLTDGTRLTEPNTPSMRSKFILPGFFSSHEENYDTELP